MARTFAELFIELKAEAIAEWAAIANKVVEFEHTIVPIIEADIVAVLSQFKTLAVKTVIEMGAAGMAQLSGGEKFGTVVTRVFMAAQAAGKQVAIEDVRLLAQQAFNAVSGALAPK